MRRTQSIRHLFRQSRSFYALAAGLWPFAKAMDQTIPSRVRLAPAHVHDFIRWSGGLPDDWKGHVPPTLFPYWTMPSLAACLVGRELDMPRMLNGGCRIVQHRPLSIDETFTVQSRFESLTEHERFKMITIGSETRCMDQSLALESHVRFIIPTRKVSSTPRPALYPEGKVVGKLIAESQDGFNFACLTGDPNPIHWLTPWAKLSGFKQCILHGFGTLARSYERLLTETLLVRNSLTVDVDFRHPVPLPSTAEVYCCNDEVSVWVLGAQKPSLVGTIQQ